LVPSTSPSPGPGAARLYVEALEPLTRREIERFYGRLAGSGTVEDAARMAQAGIELINDLIALLRTRMLLGLVAEMNANAVSQAASPAGS